MQRDRGRINGIAARAGHWSATHRKKAIGIWVAFVVVGLIGGGSVGQRTLTDAESGVGESKAADLTLDKKGPKDPASESVLIRSNSQAATSPAFSAAIHNVRQELQSSDDVARVHPPKRSRDGHAALVNADLKGDPNKADETADSTFAAVDRAKRASPGFEIGVAGDGTANKQLSDSINDDFAKAETLSIPITLLILVVAFGALVAAGIPVVLAISAVMATIGLVSVPSHVFPVDESIGSVILLIGMAVGVDYSLFYLRREREERAGGRSPRDAIDAAAATSGRAVLISGLTVIAAMAGMFLSGNPVFISFGIGTLLVVAIAMLGSLTFLPAMMSLLGDRMEKGRIPFLSRRRSKAGESRAWTAIVRTVVRRPAVAIAVAGGALIALTIPAFGMNVKSTGVQDFPQDLSTIRTYNEIQQLYPSEHPPALLVVQAGDVRSPQVRTAINQVSTKAQAAGVALGGPDVRINDAGTVASVSMPLAGNGENDRSKNALSSLRNDLIPAAFDGTGAKVQVSGDTASNVDWQNSLKEHLPLVFGFVLTLAFLLLLVTFRSIVVPITSIGLNLLSVGAAYGILVLVFQHGFAQGLLGVHSEGVTSWLPLFLFVVLFGLSMDYHVFILSRIKELVDRGMPTEKAIERGIGSTAGTVTSAAIVMVAVFSIFATLSFIDFKQMGVGLAAAILIDATVIRGVLLPATMKLLGERNWYLPSWLEWLPRRRGVVPHDDIAAGALPEPASA
ncbi:MAG TPA: MMPL family transporter [Solirubrobacterales bacterium]